MDELEKRAREFAVASGHKSDAEIVCVGGRREAVWRFYRDEAAEQLMRDQAAGAARQACDRHAILSEQRHEAHPRGSSALCGWI
jgi:hypothetical protein